MKKKILGLLGLFSLAMMIGLVSCPSPDPVVDDPAAGEGFSITFSANGGTFEGGESSITWTSRVPSFIGRDYPIPTTHPDNLHFVGYFTSPAPLGDTGPLSPIRITERDWMMLASYEFTAYAHWATESQLGAYIDSFIDEYLLPVFAAYDLNNIIDNIRLPFGITLSYLFEVVWVSSRQDVIDNYGMLVNGILPPNDTTVNLDLTVNYGSVTRARPGVVNMTVINNVSVANNILNLAESRLNAAMGDLSAVALNLTLPLQVDVAGGALVPPTVTEVSVTWISTSPVVLSNTGVVTRPEASDAAITLNATLTAAGVDRIVPFPVTVLSNQTLRLHAADEVIRILGVSLGNLGAVRENLTLLPSVTVEFAEIDWVVSASWSSSNTAILSNAGVVNRPQVTGEDVTLTVTLSIDSVEVTTHPFLARIISLFTDDVADALFSLGDLSTVTQNITLPMSFGSYDITWTSSNQAVVTDAGIVTRPVGTEHGISILTGTFSQGGNFVGAADRDVRVMRQGAEPSEFLNVHFVVGDDGVLRNIAHSGDFYQAVLMGDAVADETAGHRFIRLPNTNSWVDLGPNVGALMRGEEWTIMFYANIPTDAGTFFGFANDRVNDNTTNWRGTLQFHNPALWFRARNAGSTPATGDQTASIVSVGGSGGIGGGRVNRWNHLTVVKHGSAVGIMRNGGQATHANRGGNFSRIHDDPIFGAADAVTPPLRYAYLGRAPFLHAPNNVGANSRFMDIRIYSRALANPRSGVTPPDFEYISLPDDLGINLGSVNAINSAFGHPNTN
ncbi:MAG: hypothetical protein FWC97_00090 [Treponema sp.]|nr:hypothetical protein [Treponema sp.]